MRYSNAVENYFQNVIKKSWTWGKLTAEEQQRFIDMNVFDKIKGTDKQRVEWLNTIYKSYLAALNYKPLGWRENTDNENKYTAFTELDPAWGGNVAEFLEALNIISVTV